MTTNPSAQLVPEAIECKFIEKQLNHLNKISCFFFNEIQVGEKKGNNSVGRARKKKVAEDSENESTKESDYDEDDYDDSPFVREKVRDKYVVSQAGSRRPGKGAKNPIEEPSNRPRPRGMFSIIAC